MKPKILLHRKNHIAFEELIKQDAEKYIKKSKSRKIFDISKQYAVVVALPNVVAGTIGYMAAGQEGALEAMKQASVAIVPIMLAAQSISDYQRRKQPLDQINYVIDVTIGPQAQVNAVEKPFSCKFTQHMG